MYLPAILYAINNVTAGKKKSCMPELPEVQTVVSTLQPRLVGRRINAIRLSQFDVTTPTGTNLSVLLSGRTVTSIDRRAKRVVFTLDNGDRFYIHLGMSGRLTIAPATDAIAPHTHVVLETDAFEVRFVDPRRFGGVWWMGADPDDADLGPEPLTLRTAELATRLKRTRRPIKAALLDQTLIAGLGNIYVDESLFVAGIHPLKRADRLTSEQIERLNRAIKQVLRRAIRAKGSSLRDYVDANGSRGSFQKLHSVYDRAGQPCRTCNTPIKRIVLSGRSTHFCPTCQTRRKA